MGVGGGNPWVAPVVGYEEDEGCGGRGGGGGGNIGDAMVGCRGDCDCC